MPATKWKAANSSKPNQETQDITRKGLCCIVLYSLEELIDIQSRSHHIGPLTPITANTVSKTCPKTLLQQSEHLGRDNKDDVTGLNPLVCLIDIPSTSPASTGGTGANPPSVHVLGHSHGPF